MITISVAVTIVVYLCVSVLKVSRWARWFYEDAHDEGANDDDDEGADDDVEDGAYDDDDDDDDDDRNNEGETLLEKMTVARLQSSANGTTWLTRYVCVCVVVVVVCV